VQIAPAAEVIAVPKRRGRPPKREESTDTVRYPSEPVARRRRIASTETVRYPSPEPSAPPAATKRKPRKPNMETIAERGRQLTKRRSRSEPVLPSPVLPVVDLTQDNDQDEVEQAPQGGPFKPGMPKEPEKKKPKRAAAPKRTASKSKEAMAKLNALPVKSQLILPLAAIKASGRKTKVVGRKPVLEYYDRKDDAHNMMVRAAMPKATAK